MTALHLGDRRPSAGNSPASAEVRRGVAQLVRAVESAAELCVMASPTDPQELLRLAECCEQVVEAAAAAGVRGAERRAIQARDLLRAERASAEMEGVIAAASRTVAEIQELVQELEASHGEVPPGDRLPQGEAGYAEAHLAGRTGTEVGVTPGVDGADSSERSEVSIQGAADPGPSELPSELKADPESDQEIVDELVAESLEYLEAIERSLLALEEDPGNPEAVNAVFRGFHTIKGGAGFLGLKAISELAHIAETLLDGVRSGGAALTGELLDELLAGADLLKTLIGMVPTAVATGGQPLPEEYPEVIARLFASTQNQLTPAAGHESPAPPPAEASRLEPERVGDALDPETSTAPSATVEVAARATPKTPAVVADQAQRPAQVDTTVKVSTRKLDGLVNMVGELVIAQSMVAQDPTLPALTSQRLMRNMSHMARMTRELQELAMSMRMVPLRSTFQRMARIARDVAHRSGKKMVFSVVGEDTELDRNLVEEISAPLIHLVRNAVDHGVEPERERIEQGKPGTGKVELRAYHGSGNVVIEIRDDGRGMNRERILKKARERGLVKSGKELTDRQAFSLCFRPGFSTAEKVTDLSGRGVGLDVVKGQIEALRGRVDVDSAVGHGTTFSIKIPLTLAIIDGMVVAAGPERYIIPTDAIECCLKATPDMVFTVGQQSTVVVVRGSTVPLFALGHLFGIKGSTDDACEGVVIIVEHQGRRCALVVDDLLGQKQVVIKGLGGAFRGLEGIAAASILGDGRVGLILDIPDVIRLATRTSGGPPPRSQGHGPSASSNWKGYEPGQVAPACSVE